MSLEWWQYTLLALAGLGAGFIDAIAGGGGLITVPALLWAGLPPQIALGTNKLQSSCGTTLAVWRYSLAGLIAWRNLRWAIGVTFAAAVLGTWTAVNLRPDTLARVVPFLLAAVAIYTAVTPRLGAQAHRARMGFGWFAAIFGTLLGFYDGFFGPGAGSFWMLACVLALGQDLRSAAGTTKALNLTSNVASLLAFGLAGCLRWDVGAAMIAGQLCGARLGSGLVLTKGAKVIRPIFIATALALAAKLAWDAMRQ